MPRTARVRFENAIYHVMSRSISEVDLFQNDEDKSYFLSLLKRYKEKNCCKIYAYCIMNNHFHIFIDPCGFDISTFMRSLNGAYVSYFNRKYSRHGILFQGRFASKIVENNTYALTLCAYISNNPKDIPGFSGKEDLYRYSSYGVYTGRRKDTEGLLDMDFILEMFSKDIVTARQKIKIFTEAMRDTGIMKEVDDDIINAYTENEYRSEKRQIIRNTSPDDLINKIGTLFGEKLQDKIYAKHSREMSKSRAFVVYIMRTICGFTYKKICEYIGNMSMSGVSRLSSQGFKLVCEDDRYRNMFNSLIYSN